MLIVNLYDKKYLVQFATGGVEHCQAGMASMGGDT